VLTKPHRTHRDRAEQAVVWRRRRASWGTSAVIFFALAVVGAVGGWGTTLVALDLAAGVMSAAVVVKAQVMVRRAEEVPPAM
jgi:Flp pilus assembly CpaE family ATPase